MLIDPIRKYLTMTVYMRCKWLYISLPSSAQPQREMIKFCVAWGRRSVTASANYSYFHLKLQAAMHCIFNPKTFLKASRRTEQIKTVAIFADKMQIQFLLGAILDVDPTKHSY